jgi:mono/diheme cytochrome c family protein
VTLSGSASANQALTVREDCERFLPTDNGTNKMLGIGRHLLLLACTGALLSIAPLAAPAAENETSTGAQADAGIPVPEIKKLFANNCSWCHGAYGMTADKGPRLAGTKMTEDEVRERIRHGKEGYMPSFAKVLNEQQIAAFAKYIKSLTPAD